MHRTLAPRAAALALAALFAVSPQAALAQLKTGPPLPLKLVKDWAKLPDGWNTGESSGVAVDKNDNVYIFNRGAHPLIKLDKSGKFLAEYKEVPVLSSHGVRIDQEGNIWLADVKGHSILQFSPTFRLKMQIGNPGKSPGDNSTPYAFNQPTGVSFAANGDFYVSDGYGNSRVVKYSKAGDFIAQWGRKGNGDGEFDLVHDVAVDAKGNVYVADRTNQRVQVFDGAGKFVTKWTGLGSPWGLIYEARENVLYMCDGVNNRVLKLNLDGQILGELGSFGKAPGKFDFAHNIAVDSEGSIYVAEIKNWRVQKFAK